MSVTHAKTSGELAQEVEAQRTRVETTIGEIQDRLSPGQLIDELLNYTKSGPGSEFVSNLGRSVSSNPLPVALMGISLAWLMAKQGSTVAASGGSVSTDIAAPSGRGSEAESRQEHRYAIVNGRVRLVGRSMADDGRSYSEFADDTGRKYRALTGNGGERAGDFIDESGASFRGFKDAAGERIQTMGDQAGSVLDAASDWLSDAWDSASDGVGKAASSMAAGRDAVQANVSDVARQIGQQARQSGNTLLGSLHDQPLVGGALAFAVGAAIAAALPHTRQEDEAFGEAADTLRAKAGDVTRTVYAEGKEQVSEIYQRAADRAGEMLDATKSGDQAPEVQPAEPARAG
ncbi:Protein of unknown function [Kaistia soli DSM 19436]|uniref:Nutrient deprivation-induced protein n=1 Tax=Kaistia soli DSM 19436 TaxID=1122133 RepID=A0A1M5PYU5_9HYPH|nr:DUF3618 domain-containing protein [Kaistia soli]SHH07075.1 Protein of unknown function [Kaistia soli DSM 19436]